MTNIKFLLNKQTLPRLASIILFIFILNVATATSFAFDSRSTTDATKAWSVKFNIPLDEKTVNSKNLRVYEKSTQNLFPIFVSMNANDNKIALIEPLQPYDKNKTYTLVITTDVKSGSGELLKKEVSMDFVVIDDELKIIDTDGLGTYIEGLQKQIEDLKNNPVTVNKGITLITNAQATAKRNQVVKVDIGEKKKGIAVTLTIRDPLNLNEEISKTVATDSNGIATYTYTREKEKSVDFITAYLTGESNINDTAHIFWAEDKSGYDTVQDLIPYEIGSSTVIDGGWGDKEVFTIRQKEYSSFSSISADRNSADVTYIIDGKYKSITGLYGVDDTTYYTGGRFVIYGDGKEIYETSISKGTVPTNIDVSLEGVQTLRIWMWGVNTPRQEFFDIKLNK